MTIYLLNEAAAKMGVSRVTLFRWIKAGKVLPGVVSDTAGNVVGFECVAFDNYLESVK